MEFILLIIIITIYSIIIMLYIFILCNNVNYVDELNKKLEITLSMVDIILNFLNQLLFFSF